MIEDKLYAGDTCRNRPLGLLLTGLKTCCYISLKVYSIWRIQMRIKTKRAIIFFLFLGLAIPTLAYSAKVAGTVISKQGQAQVLHEGEREWKDLLLRSKVYEKDTIETKENSKVKILFLDESLMNLGEKSKMEITEQTYEPGKKRVSLYNLMSGKVRVLVGKISGEESRFEVKTPTALAAVRGTELFVWVKSATITQVFAVSVEPGKEVVVENLQIPGVTVTVSENFTTLVEAGAPPTAPTPATVEEIKQLFNDTNVSGDITSGGGPAAGGGESIGGGETGGGEVFKPADTGPTGGTGGGAPTGDVTGVGAGPTGGETGGKDILTTPGEGSSGGKPVPPEVEQPKKGHIRIKF